MKKILLICLIFISSLYCQKIVTVSILPQKYFIEKIAKDKIEVNVMVMPGASPATYEPKTSQMKDLISSDIYFSIGVPFEKTWLAKFQNINKNMKIVDTSFGIKKLEMGEHHHEGESHHSDEEVTLDPHIWLDPILVKIQAKNILDALIQMDKDNRAFYYDNYKTFLVELDNLHYQLSKTLISVKGKKIMVFHPSWGYFASRYDIEQEAVEKEGKDPKPKEIISLIDEAKKDGIKVVFVAPQFSKKSAEIIANGIGGKTIFIDPLSINWQENLINVANTISSIYE